MSIFDKLKPNFWDHPEAHDEHGLSYRNMWKINFGVAVATTLLPLVLLTLIAFFQSEKHRMLEESAAVKHAGRLLIYNRLQAVHHISERQVVMEFVAGRWSTVELVEPGRLEQILKGLNSTFEGFTSLGLYGNDGRQLAFTGTRSLEKQSTDTILPMVLGHDRNRFVSEVFEDNGKHYLALAVRTRTETGEQVCLVALVDSVVLDNIAANLETVEKSDAMILNRQGILQTASQYHGKILTFSGYDTRNWDQALDVIERTGKNGASELVGYAVVSGTPFFLVVTRPMGPIIGKWRSNRNYILLFAVVSIIVILVVVFKGTVQQVSRLYDAYRKQTAILREIENTNKLASVGRLAAGVAHEINNPMAIINEKAGLLQDLLEYGPSPPDNDKLMGLTDSIMESVKRVSTITHRLLGFARHLRVRIEILDLKKIVEEVLSFLGKEARYRNIDISTDIPDDIPAIESDKALLEQVLLNIINNALSEINDGGKIDIAVSRHSEDKIALSIADDGRGIKPEHLKHVFEPFFTTKGENGTGLGLSITYGIVKKMGGWIEVESEVGRGARFTVVLPIITRIAENKAGRVETTIAGDPGVS